MEKKLKKYSIKNDFDSKVGLELSKKMFINFNTETGLSSLLHKTTAKEYKKKHGKDYLDRHINEYCQRWKSKGLFQHSPPTFVENDKNIYQKKKIRKKRLNLNFIFEFAKQNKIKFSNEEKQIFNSIFIFDNIREEILKDYPNDNLIDAVLKFYVKNFIMTDYAVLSVKERQPDKFKDEENKFNNIPDEMLKTHEKLILEITQKFNPNKIYKKPSLTSYIVYNRLKNRLLFTNYYNKKNDSPDLIKNLDNKILKLMGLYPNNINF